MSTTPNNNNNNIPPLPNGETPPPPPPPPNGETPPPPREEKPTILPHTLPKFSPININLHTNLPDEEDKNGLATKIFPLTGDMMGAPGDKPFFSSEIDYSYGASFFMDLPREEQIKVFFDVSTFRKFITECYTQKLNKINRSGALDNAKEEYDRQKKEALEENGIAERNVLFMLNKLIKVSFPKKTAVKETYSLHKTTPLSVLRDPIGTLRRFYSPFVYYTYLKYGGKDYTVVKARWQNDFYSHPEFFKLYNLYRLYDEWFSPEKKEEIIEKFKKDATYFTGTQLYNENIVEYIVMAFARDFMKYEDAENYLKSIMTFKGETLEFKEYAKRKEEIDEILKKFKKVEERQKFFRETDNEIVAIKDFELVSSRARYSDKDITKSQLADFENYKKLIKKIYDFIKDQPDWANYNETKKETINKIKENIYNKKLRCLLSDITYLSKDAKTGEGVKVDDSKKDCIPLLADVRREIERRAFYVGVQKKGGVNGEFEISLYVDLFGGKIDQKNKEQYRCAFLGEKLGNEFEALWNGRYYVKSRFFFDAPDFDDDDADIKSGLEKKDKEKNGEDDDDDEKEKDDDDDGDKSKRRRRRRRDRDDDDDSEYEGGRSRPNKKTLRARFRKKRRRTFKKVENRLLRRRAKALPNIRL